MVATEVVVLLQEVSLVVLQVLPVQEAAVAVMDARTVHRIQMAATMAAPEM